MGSYVLFFVVAARDNDKGLFMAPGAPDQMSDQRMSTAFRETRLSRLHRTERQTRTGFPRRFGSLEKSGRYRTRRRRSQLQCNEIHSSPLEAPSHS